MANLGYAVAGALITQAQRKPKYFVAAACLAGLDRMFGTGDRHLGAASHRDDRLGQLGLVMLAVRVSTIGVPLPHQASAIAGWLGDGLKRHDLRPVDLSE